MNGLWSIVRLLTVMVTLLGVCNVARDAGAQTALPPGSKAKATHLQVRYADARLRLAEVDLEIAIGMNKKIKGTVGSSELKRLQANVELARQQLDIAKEQTHASAFPNQVSAAEAAAKLADLELSSSLKINKRSPGTIPEIRIKRLKIKVEMTNLRIELWRDPGYLPSLLDSMQWQIDRLTVQIIELNGRLEAVERK